MHMLALLMAVKPHLDISRCNSNVQPQHAAVLVEKLLLLQSVAQLGSTHTHTTHHVSPITKYASENQDFG